MAKTPNDPAKNEMAQTCSENDGAKKVCFWLLYFIFSLGDRVYSKAGEKELRPFPLLILDRRKLTNKIATRP